MNDLFNDENYIDYSYSRADSGSTSGEMDPTSLSDGFSFTAWILTYILNVLTLSWNSGYSAPNPSQNNNRTNHRSRVGSLRYLIDDNFDDLFTDQ